MTTTATEAAPELVEVPAHHNDLGDYCPRGGERTADGTCPVFCREADELVGFDAGRVDEDEDPVATSEFRVLCGEVARELAGLRGETWEIEHDDGYRYRDMVIVAGPDHARLCVSDNRPADKVTLSGLYPYGYGRKLYSANVTRSRGARAIASALSRRVLDAGYPAALARALARKAEDDQRDAERLMWLRRVAELVGGHAPVKADQEVSFGDWDVEPPAVRGSVKAYYKSGDLMNVQLTAVPAEVVLRMLAILVEPPEAGS
jgi:hypothetical protein